jgi:anti-sigma factor RsiW
MRRSPDAGAAGDANTAPTDADAELLRSLAGELSPDRAAELDRRVAALPALAARRAALARGWEALAPPAEAALPPALAARVMAAVRREAGAAGGLSWRLAPVWVRAAAAAALAAGIALGVGLGHRASSGTDALSLSLAPPESLAASYWTAVEDATAEPPAQAGARP